MYEIFQKLKKIPQKEDDVFGNRYLSDLFWIISLMQHVLNIEILIYYFFGIEP